MPIRNLAELPQDLFFPVNAQKNTDMLKKIRTRKQKTRQKISNFRVLSILMIVGIYMLWLRRDGTGPVGAFWERSGSAVEALWERCGRRPGNASGESGVRNRTVW